MRADGGIDAAARAFGCQHQIVQHLAHPVQALEFISLGPQTGSLRHVQDGGDGMGIVGRELRIDPVGHPQKPARIGDIADVGMRLRREDREIRQPLDLGRLDL